MRKYTFINNSGFTLIEALVGLILISLICFINVNLINVALNYNNAPQSNLFYIANMINNECIIYDEVIVSNNELKIFINDELIKYSYKDNVIIRTVDNKGYVAVSQSDKITFKYTNQKYVISDGRYDAYIC